MRNAYGVVRLVAVTSTRPSGRGTGLPALMRERVLMNEPSDPGKHAVDSAAGGSSSGYELSNGQVDDYADRDTVPWDAALQALRCLVDG